MRGAGAEERLRGKMVMLDNTRTQTEQGKQEVRLRRQLLRKRPRVGKEAKAEMKAAQSGGDKGRVYEDHVPLHECWRAYMSGVLSTEMEKQRGGSMAQRLMMVDLHGAILTVGESKVGSDVGLSGLVIRESRSAFHLLTLQNKVKIVPKKGHVFSFDIDGRCVRLHGNGLIDRHMAMASPLVVKAGSQTGPTKYITNVSF